ncbi:MAG: glycosyltransferase family 39 protein [Undibacterium sp.]|nr:glycosyltransferase family 39 protein [Opitutaceae bacterium]
MEPLSFKSHPGATVPCIATILLLLFAAFCYRAADDTSVTFDEPIHILAGYSYGARDGPETLTANLRAAQLWLAVPLRSLGLHYPEALQAIPGVVVDVEMKVTRDFIHDPRHDPAQILRASRAAITVLGTVLGLVLFVWSRRLFGDAAGLLTLGLYCFEPTVIAHSSLATTDIAATLAFTLAVAAWWRLLHRVSLGNIMLCGLATGVLAATKISAGLLAPTVAAMLLARLVWRRDLPGEWGLLSSAAAGALVLAYGVIWGLYGFHYASGWRLTDSAWTELLVPQATPVQRVLNCLRIHELLPEAYLYDFNTFINNLGGRRAYLLGAYSVEGWWYYFPVAWLTKTSLPTLVALALGVATVGVALLRRGRDSLDFYPLVPLLAFGVIYTASALASPMNIGIRHLLPVYPMLFILAGLGVKLWPGSAPRARGLLVAGLIAWSAGVAWNASPYFLAYFNPAAGGTGNGHRILVESNFDWGQDLPEVARWLEHRAATPATAGERVFFSYYGLGDPARYAIHATLLPQDPDFRPPTIYDLKPGTYVIGATMLQALGGPRVWGPWRPSFERVYRALGLELAPLYAEARTSKSVGAPGRLSSEWAQKVALYDELRFARLCAYLRPRSPSARITPTTFAYFLAEENLAAALDGPPPFGAETTIKGLSRLPPGRVDFLR